MMIETREMTSRGRCTSPKYFSFDIMPEHFQLYAVPFYILSFIKTHHHVLYKLLQVLKYITASDTLYMMMSLQK